MTELTIGVVGYERLGTWFVNFCKPFKSRILVYDPTRDLKVPGVTQVDLDTLLSQSDVLSLHVYWPPDQSPRIDMSWLSRPKKTAIIVNTGGRGDIVDTASIIEFLSNNPNAFYATDVFENEITSKKNHQLIVYARSHENIIITPHLGGQTKYGQERLYQRAAEVLGEFLRVRMSWRPVVGGSLESSGT